MGTHRLIYIRTDGNAKIATGHLVRCVSVSEACRKLGMEVRFLVSDEESRSLLTEFLAKTFPAKEQPSVRVLLTAVYDDLEKELPEVLSLLAEHDASVYLLDSYYATENYFAALKPFVKIAYLDDLRHLNASIELVVNYDVIPESLMPEYQDSYKNAGLALLGAAYAPLRPQFQNRKITVKERASEVLVTTGGSDAYHFCCRFLQAIPKKTAFTFHIVIGKLNTDRELLYSLAKELPFVELHENVTDMAALMERCDLAVSAAGTTLYELCALGIPAVSFAVADNQLPSAKSFACTGVLPFAGDIRTSYESVLSNVFTFLTDMSENYQKRKSAQETMHSFIDGNGARRIAEAIKGIMLSLA